MAEVGCLKDGHFQNLQVQNTTILESLGESITITSVTSNRPLFILEHTGTTPAESAEIRLEKDSTDTFIHGDEQLGKITFHGQDGDGAQGEVVALEATMPSIVSSGESGKLSFKVSSGGSAPTEALSIAGSGVASNFTTLVTIPGNLAWRGSQMHTPVAVNTTAVLTAAQVASGYITSTSAASVTMTLPTGTLLGAYLDAVQGTVIELYIDNTVGVNPVTMAIAVNGIKSDLATDVAASAGLLEVTNGVTGGARFTLMFSSPTAYTFTRTA